MQASLVAQLIKNLPAMQDTQVRSLGWEDPLEKEMATHSVLFIVEFHRQKSQADYRLWDHKELIWETGRLLLLSHENLQTKTYTK